MKKYLIVFLLIATTGCTFVCVGAAWPEITAAFETKTEPLLAASTPGLPAMTFAQWRTNMETRLFEVEKVKNASQGEEVIHLPEDGTALALTVFTHADWAQRANERELLSWFATNRTLAALKSQCHFFHLTPEHPGYALFSGTIHGDFPAVMIQHHERTKRGQVIYKASAHGGQIPFPSTPDDLAAEMLAAVNARRDCLPCRPRPVPTPAPDVRPEIPAPNVLPPGLPNPLLDVGRTTAQQVISGIDDKIVYAAAGTFLAVGFLFLAAGTVLGYGVSANRKHAL